MQEVKKTEQEMALDKKIAENQKFRDELLKVHNQLKTKADLFNALKERGIESVEGLQKAIPQQTSTKEDKPTTEELPIGNSEVEALKKQVAELNQTVQNQSTQMQVNKTLSDIKTAIKDKPEYALLNKAVNESIAFNILKSQHEDKKKGVTKDMNSYLNTAEQELRGFFTKLGGKVPEEGEQKAVSEGTTQLTKPSPSEDTGEITFPSLPSGGTGETKPADFLEKLQELGKHPVTGKYDRDLAFENANKSGMFDGAIQ